MSQSHFSAAVEDKIYFFLALQPVKALTVLVGLWCFGGSLGGVAFSLRWVWVLRDLQEQIDTLTRRWEALGGGADMQVEVAFSVIYVCTKMVDCHVPFFPPPAS